MMIIDKVIKNILWDIRKRKFNSVGSDCRIGLDFSVSGEKYISMGSHFRGGKHIIIDAIDRYNGIPQDIAPRIVIGDHVTLADSCYLSCIREIRIGDGAALGQNVFVTDNSHGNGSFEEIGTAPTKRSLYSKGPVVIGSNVWIGRNVCIMPGVTVGDGATIGANAVVTHDIPANCVAAGVPARVIREIK